MSVLCSRRSVFPCADACCRHGSYRTIVLFDRLVDADNWRAAAVIVAESVSVIFGIRISKAQNTRICVINCWQFLFVRITATVCFFWF